MNFEFTKSLEILQRSPKVIDHQLRGISREWSHYKIKEDSWSAFDIVGHFIHGERTDWIPRARIICADGTDKLFPVFDRFAQIEASRGKAMNELLDCFQELRSANIQELLSWNLKDEDWNKTGVHPEFGEVTLRELISCWAVHDLVHINQMTRVMAHYYKEDIGPWIQYMNLLKES